MVIFLFQGFAMMKNEPPQHHRYDNLATETGHHYQNHFFATIYDSDGANGGPEFFERQNSNGGSFERQSSLGEPEVIIREKVGSYFPYKVYGKRNWNEFIST